MSIRINEKHFQDAAKIIENAPIYKNSHRKENANQVGFLGEYASLYSKDKESASPGYYQVMLDRYDIKVELTATERSGLHRYTFPESSKSRIIIDLGEGSADRPTDTYLRQINDMHIFEGYRYSIRKGICTKKE